MPRWTLPLLLLAACATADEAPADTDETAGSDTDAGGGDTDVVDTDEGGDTDVFAPACEPGTLGAGHQLLAEPDVEQDVTFRRVIDVCADDGGLSGTWTTEITDASGDRFCGFEVSFTSATTAACADCELAFRDVTFTGASFSDVELCGLFGLDQALVDGWDTAYAKLGIDADSEDLWFFDAEASSWTALDQTPETVHDLEDVDGVSHLTLTFETTYPY